MRVFPVGGERVGLSEAQLPEVLQAFLVGGRFGSAPEVDRPHLSAERHRKIMNRVPS